MSDLLELALAAHGGRERWQRIERLTAKTTIGGTLWHLKAVPGVFDETEFTAYAHRQRLEIDPVGEPGRRGIYEPDHIELVAEGGVVLDSRDKPRASFADHQFQTPWSELDAVYFGGYAMWTYLTTPFLLTLPGVETEEVEPWDEEGETWRRLKVTFPDDVHSHCAVQTFYFNTSGLLRRQDYSVDIMGGTDSAHYALAPKTFGGIVIPTRRRVYSTGPDNKPLRDRVAISIDIHDVEVV